MYKTKKARIPAVYRILLVAIAVIAIGGIAVNCYVGNYYHADSIAEAAIDSDSKVSRHMYKYAHIIIPCKLMHQGRIRCVLHPASRIKNECLCRLFLILRCKGYRIILML